MNRLPRARAPFWILATPAVLVAAMILGSVATIGRAQTRSDEVHYRHFRVDGPDGESQRLVASIPRRRDREMNPPGERYPMLIALHGRGEAAQGERRGFLGWTVDYELAPAFGAMQRIVRRQDYGGLVRDEHLATINAELRAKPFVGMIVVTPYTPDLLAEGTTEEDVARWIDWLAGPFVDQVRERFEGTIALTREGTGVDGISLGGWLALEAGFRHPEVFGVVGAMQPAITGRVDALAERAGKIEQPQALRLLTSDDDPLRPVTLSLSEKLRERMVAHRLVVVPGPHDYEFNRGPGRMELLRFGHQALVREPIREDQ